MCHGLSRHLRIRGTSWYQPTDTITTSSTSPRSRYFLLMTSLWATRKISCPPPIPINPTSCLTTLRHIDTNFCLYRHGVFGELKKALSGLPHAALDDPSILARPIALLGDVRAYHYSNAYVTYINFDVRRELQAQISFPQPPGACHLSAGQRRIW